MISPAHTLAWLIGLSILTTILARVSPANATVWVGLAFLILAGLKARMILGGFLGLNATQFWRRGFNGFITAFLIGVALLFFAAG